jgi:uncharacterized protein YjbI with pentapeptide repeats
MGSQETGHFKHTKCRIEAETANLSGSSFNDVNLSGSTFTNVNLAEAQFDDANLSGWRVRNANFAGLHIEDADLRGAAIMHSLTTSMTIDGISVDDLMAAYRTLSTKQE